MTKRTVILSAAIIVLASIIISWSYWLHNPKSPESVVADFYNWYIKYPRVSEREGTFKPPLNSAEYRNNISLTSRLIKDVDRAVTRDSDIDPILLTEDIPEKIVCDRAVIIGNDADVIVNEWFSGGSSPHSIRVDLKKIDGSWKIDEISVISSISY